jgi:hypothetical protein
MRIVHPLLTAALILGPAPALTILDQPTAVATPFAQEPSGPQLSGEEQQAIDDENAGRPVKDPKVLSSAKQKIQTQEKYDGERNKQKRDNNKRGGGRKR